MEDKRVAPWEFGEKPRVRRRDVVIVGHCVKRTWTTLGDSGITHRPDFSGYFGDDGITFKRLGYRALSFRRLPREHDFQTRRLAIFEQSDIYADDTRDREQFLVVIAQDGVDVALRRRRIILRHVFPATGSEGYARQTNETYRPMQSVWMHQAIS